LSSCLVVFDRTVRGGSTHVVERAEVELYLSRRADEATPRPPYAVAR
jgi:hypothetical protein